MKLFGPGLGGGTTEEARVNSPVDAPIDVLFERLIRELRALPDGALISAASSFVPRLENERLLAAARLAGSSGDPVADRRKARSALRDASRSKRSVAHDARRAAAVAANEGLGQQVADGEISADGIDALARASNEETGRIPEDLVNAAAGLPPDQAARLVTTYLEDAAKASEVNETYRRQMEARQVRRYVVPADAGRPAMAGLGIEGPEALIDRMWSEVNARADAAYHAAGGRDRPHAGHATLAHRRFDAARDVFSASTKSSSSRGNRPAVVVTVDAEQRSSASARTAKPAVQIGTGPISDELLAEYASTGTLSVVVAGMGGSPLWLGRARRHASAHQFLALAIRDRGCVLCSAGIDRCVAHHVTPWSAPAKGRTDLDNLALLCQSCHRSLHDRNHTLTFTQRARRKRIWTTRPATPAETPAPRPEVVQRE